MSEIPPLNVRINLDASGVQAGVAKATAGVQAISDKSKTLGMQLSSLKSIFIGTFGGIVASQGLFALTRIMGDMKQEAIATEVATRRLDFALENLKTVTAAQTKSVYDNLNAYASLGFEDSDLAQSMGTLVTATGSVEQSQKLMALAADLARYKHISLESASRILARGTQGAARAFKEMGITLDASLPKNEAIAKAFDQLNAKIGGEAVSYTKTFAGQVQVIQEKFDAWVIILGNFVLPILTKMLQAFGGLATWISQNSAALSVMTGILVTMVVALKGWAAVQYVINALLLANPIGMWIVALSALSVLFVTLWNRFKIFRDSMAEGLATIVGLVGYLVGAVGKLIRAMSYLPGMGFLKGVADGFDKVAISVGNAAKAVDDLKNKKITAPSIAKISGVTAPGGKTGILGATPTGGGKGSGTAGGGSAPVQYVTVYASNTNDIYKKLSKAAKAGVPVGSK